MFGQLTEQMKKSSKPASDLFAANVKAVEAVSQQQTQFLSGVLEDSVKLLQTMSQQTETKGLIAAQSVYAESVRDRFMSTSKIVYGTMNSVSQQYADALKTSLESADVSSAPAVAKKEAPVKKSPSAKAAPAKAKTVNTATVQEDAPATASKAVTTTKAASASKASPKKSPAKPVAKKAAPKTVETPTLKPVETSSAVEASAVEAKTTPTSQAASEKSSNVDAKTIASPTKSAK